MYTSSELEQGRVYTRRDLQQKYDITDATLNNGIFRPKGHDSVWLFVTETKSSDRTQYADLLAGDTLRWDGQSYGRTDRLIIDHESHGLELLVFYRKTKTEHPGAGFTYEGPFRYLSHSGANPTHFVLQRVDPIAEVVARDLQALQAEESYQEGARSSVLINKYERNPKLRAAAIAIHGTTCQGCGFSFGHVYGPRGDGFIEVHHLRPLADYPGEIAVDPRTDMAVLCSNCHRMVHRKVDELLDLDALRCLVDAGRATR